MNKLAILRIEKSTVYFTYSEKVELQFKILVKDKTSWSDRMSVKPGVEYFIGHPVIIFYKEVFLKIQEVDSEYTETHLMDVRQQSLHLLNIVSESVYNQIEKYYNSTYWELFIDNVYFEGVDTDWIKDVKTVVELGGNIGCFVKWINRLAYIEKYVCVEPTAEINKVNRIFNAELGDRLIIYEQLFGAVEEELDFYSCKNVESSPGDSLFPQENFYFKADPSLFNVQKIQTITLDKIIAENGLKTVDLLKVDIECAEKFLLTDENYELLKTRVKRIAIEIHTPELRYEFLQRFSKDGFQIRWIRTMNYYIINTNLVPEQKNKKVLVSIACPALGDSLCASPTIRKISQAYGHPVSVQTHRPDLFKRCPYIDQVYDFSTNIEAQYEEVFETYNQWIRVNKGMSREVFREKPIEFKLHNFEARQLHAIGVGLHLYPLELHCDFFPADQPEITKKIDKSWVVFHTTKNWENRTWPNSYWERLLDLIKQNTELKVVSIGRSHKETTYQGDMQKNVVHLDQVDLDLCVDGGKYQGQPDENSINEMWHVLNNALALISFDSGPIHLAGTTDSHIIQIGASIDPQKTTPWRKGSQAYKFHFVGGDCKRFCGSDPKYSVQEWKTINTIPYTPTCLERLDKYYCQPTPDQVFSKLLDILAI